MIPVLLLVSGLWILACLDASGKYLAIAGISVWLVSWVRYLGHLLLVVLLRWRRQRLQLFRPVQWQLQIARAAAMIISTLTFFSALKYLPLATATAINFTAPLMVLVLGPLLLKEKTYLRRYIAAGFAMAGVFLVVRPSLGWSALGIALSVLTAVLFAAYQLLTRAVYRDDVYTTSAFGAAIGVLSMSVALPWVVSQDQISLLLSDKSLLLVFLFTGVIGFFGQILQITAYQRWEANRLAPFVYWQIFASLALGWWIFGQIPDTLSLFGILIIMAAGIGIALLERRAMTATTAISTSVPKASANV